MIQAWRAQGLGQIRHAVRDESVTYTGACGCGILHAVRGKCWMLNNAKSNSVRSISGGTVNLNTVRVGLDVAMLRAPSVKYSTGEFPTRCVGNVRGLIPIRRLMKSQLVPFWNIASSRDPNGIVCP